MQGAPGDVGCIAGIVLDQLLHGRRISLPVVLQVKRRCACNVRCGLRRARINRRGRIAAVARRSDVHAWRKEVNAQGNTPNPEFLPDKFRELYVDVDPSRFDPAAADQGQWETIGQWRKGMNGVLRARRKGK